MDRRRLKIVLAYDGTDFSGWQIQKNGRTVQGAVEESLGRMHKHPVKVIAAGRTDAGVHSNGQVCHFDTDLNIPGKNYKEAINSFLPNDIAVRESVFVSNDFHARFSARKRIYKYYLVNHWNYTVFNRAFCTPVRDLPGIDLLNNCARNIIGVHDFTTFTSAGDQSETRIREVFSAVFYRENEFTVFRIEGNAFLWKMVRSIVGSILKYALFDDRGAEFTRIIESRDRSMAGTTAPAKGLFFHKVCYHERKR